MTDLQDLPFFEDPFMTNPSKSPGLSYRDAGVDIDAGDALVDRIKPLAKKTMRDGVLAGIGGFLFRSGLFGIVFWGVFGARLYTRL